MAKDYVNTRKISGYDNGKKLIEFTDRLVRARVEQAGFIHQPYFIKSAGEEKDLCPSRITVVSKDYSKGTGTAAVDCVLNIEPTKIKTLLDRIKSHDTLANSIILQLAATDEAIKLDSRNTSKIPGYSNYLLYQKNLLTSQKNLLSVDIIHDIKIMPFSDSSGLHKTTSFRITYQPDMKLKWKVYLKNSKGKLDPNGSNSLAKGTELPGNEITIFVDTDSLLNLLNPVVDYIHAWENSQLPILLDEREFFEAEWKANQNS